MTIPPMLTIMLHRRQSCKIKMGRVLSACPDLGFSTPFIPTSVMIPVTAGGPVPNFTTAFWAIPSPTTSTRTFDQARFDSLQARVKWCPDFSETTQILEGLPDDCQASWDPYCNPTVTEGQILPSPTGIASSCYPAFYTGVPNVVEEN